MNASLAEFAALESPVYGRVCAANSSRSFSQRFSCLYSQVSAGIIGLFALGSPSAVIFAIRSVVVFAVNRVLRAWTFAHVAQKGRKVVTPFVTDVDASTAVVLKGFTTWSAATLIHLRPDVPSRSQGQSVRRGAFADQFVAKTTATLRSATNYAANIAGLFCAALAATRPVWVGFVGSFVRDRNDGPAAKLTTKVLVDGAHNGLILTLNLTVFT